jgi:hypothetical protein
VSKPALGPSQPPVQWVPGVLSPGLKRGRGVTLITHPNLESARNSYVNEIKNILEGQSFKL